MMLPSGNDAAFTIAEQFANFMYVVKYQKAAIKTQDKIRSFAYGRHHIRWFLHEMNLYAKDLGLKDSYFDSPHGLMNRFNQSTVDNMARLTHACMQIPLFRKVVSSNKVQTRAKDTPFKAKTLYKWTNTNKLLGFRVNSD